jgi:hypothetical protein
VRGKPFNHSVTVSAPEKADKRDGRLKLLAQKFSYQFKKFYLMSRLSRFIGSRTLTSQLLSCHGMSVLTQFFSFPQKLSYQSKKCSGFFHLRVVSAFFKHNKLSLRTIHFKFNHHPRHSNTIVASAVN